MAQTAFFKAILKFCITNEINLVIIVVSYAVISNTMGVRFQTVSLAQTYANMSLSVPLQHLYLNAVPNAA